VALELLGRGVGGRAEVGARTRLLGGVQGAGYPEVRKFGVAAFVEEDVLGLDIPVDDAAFVGVGEGRGYVGAEAREHRFGEGAAAVHQALQVPAGDVLHHDVGDLAPLQRVLACVVDLDDVGVGEAGGRAALSPKEGARLLVVEVGAQDLDGHGPVEDLVAPEKDLGHTAGAKLPDEHEPLADAAHGPIGVPCD
jgi:hypothetical protein